MVVVNVYVDFFSISYPLFTSNRTSICVLSYTSILAQDIVMNDMSVRTQKCFPAHFFNYPTTVEIANTVCVIATSVISLAILWRKLYAHHRLTIIDVLPTMKSVACGTTAQRRHNSINSSVATEITLDGIELPGHQDRFICHRSFAILTRSHSDLSRSPQCPSCSAIRTRRTVPNSFLRPVAMWARDAVIRIKHPQQHRKAQETDHAPPQGSTEHDDIIAEPRSMADNVAVVCDAHQNVNWEDGMDEVEEETTSDEEKDV